MFLNRERTYEAIRNEMKEKNECSEMVEIEKNRQTRN